MVLLEGCCMAFTGISHDSAGLSTPWESYPPNSGSYQHIKGESDDCSGHCYSPFTLSLSKGTSEEGWFDRLTTNGVGPTANGVSEPVARKIRRPLGED